MVPKVIAAEPVVSRKGMVSLLLVNDLWTVEEIIINGKRWLRLGRGPFDIFEGELYLPHADQQDGKISKDSPAEQISAAIQRVLSDQRFRTVARRLGAAMARDRQRASVPAV